MRGGLPAGLRILGVLVCLLALTVDVWGKKKRAKIPELERVGESFLYPEFGEELANVSKAANKLQHWNEYDKVSATMRNLLIREAEKGTRVVKFGIVNPDRQFGGGGDMTRYNDVLNFMMRGKQGGEEAASSNEALMNAAMGCLPNRERYCMEKIGRASRLGTYLTVENCHRWSTASMILGDGVGEGVDMPDMSVDWNRVCSECFSKRVQIVAKAYGSRGEECLELSDEEAESLMPQTPSNWTIDVSTRTTIGGMRMEERKLLPIGGRWLPLMHIHAVIIDEIVEAGLHVRAVNDDGNLGQVITAEGIRDGAPGAPFNYAVFIW